MSKFDRHGGDIALFAFCMQSLVTLLEHVAYFIMSVAGTFIAIWVRFCCLYCILIILLW